MKKRRVLVLCHKDLIPPESREGLSEREIAPTKTEWDVSHALRKVGHEVQILGVSHDLSPLREAIESWKPHAVFNLLMEFQDVGAYQAHVVSYLELLNVHFTGCNTRGIFLTRDKALSKQILRFHRIPTPRFAVLQKGRKARMRAGSRGAPRFPLFVKSVDEEASLGISQSSVVQDEAHLRERVEFIHRSVGTDAIVEEYVEGRELTISVIGNERLTTFPVWELFFGNLPERTLPIATARVKFDLEYQKKVGIETGRAKGLSRETAKRIDQVARRAYRALGLSGYARLDLRLSPDDRISVIEVNATPDVAQDEDFASAAAAGGFSYPKLIDRIVTLGCSYRSLWQVD